MAQELTTLGLRDLAMPLLDTLNLDIETGKYSLGSLPTITEDAKTAARIIRERTQKHLIPAESEQIAGHIRLMLSHYFIDGKLPPPVITGLATQWINVLKSLPEWAIEEAVIEYLSEDKERKKPVPGQIRALADKACSKYRALIVQCDRVISAPIAPNEPEMTEEEKEKMKHRVLEILNNLKKTMRAS